MAIVNELDELIDSNIIAHGNKRLSTLLNIKLLKTINQSTFSDADLGVDISDYTFIIVEFKNGQTLFLKVGNLGGMVFDEDWIGDADYLLRRKIWTSGNDIHMDKCYGYGINGFSRFSEFSDRLVPYKIYGIKNSIV